MALVSAAVALVPDSCLEGFRRQENEIVWSDDILVEKYIAHVLDLNLAIAIKQNVVHSEHAVEAAFAT